MTELMKYDGHTESLRRVLGLARLDREIFLIKVPPYSLDFSKKWSIYKNRIKQGGLNSILDYKKTFKDPTGIMLVETRKPKNRYFLEVGDSLKSEDGKLSVVKGIK